MTAVRRAGPADLPGMLALYCHLNAQDPTPAMASAEAAWAALLGSGLATVFVADAGGVLASSCTLVVVPNLTRGARPYALVENVVTHAAHRRAGLGRAVLHAALAAAWEAGCYKVMLASGSQAADTLGFYERSGFTQGGKTYFEARRP